MPENQTTTEESPSAGETGIHGTRSESSDMPNSTIHKQPVPPTEADVETALAQPLEQESGSKQQVPKLGFVGSILYGVSRIVDSVWSGAAKLIGAFKVLTPEQATIAVMAVVLVLGTLGATVAVTAMAYVCHSIVNQPSQSAEANSALIRYMNERDDRYTAERERDYERSRRRDDQKEATASENNRKLVERLDQLSRSVDTATKTNEKVASMLERMTNKITSGEPRE